MNLYTVILMYLYFYGMPVIAAANIILAIVIICTKEKVTKLLGACAVFSGVSSLISSLYQLMIRYAGMDSISKLATFNNVSVIILGIASGIFLSLYVNKRYGTKIYIGIILIAIGSLLSMLIRVIIGRFLPPGKFDSVEMYSYFMMLLSLLPVLAADIVWFVIFIKNRVKENDLKFVWLMRLFSLIGAAANFMYYLSSMATVQNSYSIARDNSMFLVFVAIFGAFAITAIEIYILIKGRKASEDDKLTIVEN